MGPQPLSHRSEFFFRCSEPIVFAILSTMTENTVANGRSKPKPAHLFVLVHGLLGGPNHMQTIDRCLKSLLPSESKHKIVTLRPSSFRFWKTFDGLRLNAERVITDILYEIETLRNENNLKVEKISIVGYSLGGLISRYVIGMLQEIGFFDTIEPVFFTTIATPHVGVEFVSGNMFEKAANVTFQYLFGYSGPQMFLSDSLKTLVSLADPAKKFMHGLQRFQKHILMANVRNDFTVPFFTSYITPYSPFDQWSVIKIKYLKDLPQAHIGRTQVRPKFVDLTRSLVLQPTSSEKGNIQEGTSFWRRNKIAKLVAATLLIFLVPLWIPFFLVGSSFGSIYSYFKVPITKAPKIASHWDRVKGSVYGTNPVDHEDAEIGQNRRALRKKLARHDTFKGDTSELAENAMENIFYAEARLSGKNPQIKNEETEEEAEEDAGPDGTETEEEETDADSKALMILKLSSGTRVVDIDAIANDAAIKRHLPALQIKDLTQFPVFTEKTKLKLSEDQRYIIENLNQLNWIKIPVYIDAWNSHDGIISRRGPRTNTKGTATIGLWVSILRQHLKE